MAATFRWRRAEVRRCLRGSASWGRKWPKVKGKANLAVNKITWAQIGLVTEPGRYMFKFCCLTITAEDLAVWKQFPDAGFTLYSMTIPRPADGTETEEQAGEEFRLGTFELGAASNYLGSEK